MVKARVKAIAALAACLLAITVAVGARFPQPAPVSQVQRLVVQDSKGRTVGFIFGGMGLDLATFGDVPSLEARTIVLLQVGGHVVPVAVGRERFYGGGVAFELEDCQGRAWFDAERAEFQATSLLPRAAIAPPGQTLYIATPGASPETVTRRSATDLSREFGITCENRTFENVTMLPAQPLVDLSTVFTPPFSLRAAP